VTPGRGRFGKRAHDVAIYSPATSVFFGGVGMSKRPGIPQGGGAELQMALLASGLVTYGMRPALIVWPDGGREAVISPAPDLVRRPFYDGHGGLIGKLKETFHLWRAMRQADAGAYLLRGSGPQLAAAYLFCLLMRRRLIFSAAIDLDFDFARPDRGRIGLLAYRLAVRRADVVVAQRREQEQLARSTGLERVVLIPSFAEEAEDAEAAPEAFLWIGRLVGYKRPLEFIELARSLPEVEFRMVWFATDETGADLIAEVEAAGERLDNLELLGQVPRTQVLELIARAFAVVSTSEAEGVPNVFLEAWARAVPVISLQYDPDGRIAEEGLGLVAGGSSDRLRQMTESLWRDGDRRRELGRHGQEYVRRVHSGPAVTARWAEVIHDLDR
jgi:glycosyltransferase involved in cell wall biosynthesis